MPESKTDKHLHGEPTEHVSGKRERSIWFFCWRALLVTAALGLGFVFLTWILVRLLPFDPDTLFTGSVSQTITDRHGRELRSYLADDDQWRIAVPLQDMSPWVIKATLAAEDRRFFAHHGVDFRALSRAFWQNVTRGRIVSGASTLTMQVVGLTDTRERTLWRKYRQIVRAFQLERSCSKEHILSLYLTNAPYGGNVCGIEAASRRYLGKSARNLTAAEAALLAGIPQAPNRYRPDRNPSAARSRALHVLKRMRECGFLDESQFMRAQQSLPTIRATSPPTYAEHACDLARALHRAEPRIRTTIDLRIQQEAERILTDAVRNVADAGVTNGAAVVLANATGEVLALVGSVDYWNPAISGQVNGALAPRSPGSALKPFIYALALERGLILPSSVLYDVPGLFSNYDPKNFDQRWRGLVSADRALAWSLNIPAMEVLEKTGTASVLEFLDAAGVRRTMPRQGEVGLTLAVGTCSVRLLELANAYAMLARGGVFKPWRLVTPPPEDEPSLIQAARRWNTKMARERGLLVDELQTSAPARLLSADTCYLITSILSDPELRDPEEIAQDLRGLQGVAWKTGTSNGYRDAWTIAYDERFTVGIWFGNFDGKPSPALVGGRAAAPAALRMVRLLRQINPPYVMPVPLRPSSPLEPVTVCALSGERATDLCPTTRTVILPRTVAEQPTRRPCAVHRPILVDETSGCIVCSRCLQGRRVRKEVTVELPLPVNVWLASRGQAIDRREHCPDCPSIQSTFAPRILSPQEGDSYILSDFADVSTQRLRLEAAAAPEAKTLYWFVDGELLAQCAPNEVYHWLPEPGFHEVRCVDDRGRASHVTIEVRNDH